MMICYFSSQTKSCLLARTLLLVTLLLFCISMQAQVTIGSNIEPRKGLLLDLKENNEFQGNLENSKKGIGIPRVSLDSLTGLKIDDPQNKNIYDGTLIYNTKINPIKNLQPSLYYWSEGSWSQLAVKETSSEEEGSRTYKTKYRGLNLSGKKPYVSVQELNLEIRFYGAYNNLQVRLRKQPLANKNVTVLSVGHWQGQSHSYNITKVNFTITDWDQWKDFETSGSNRWNNIWGYYYLISSNEERVAEGEYNPLRYSANLYGLCGYGAFESGADRNREDNRDPYTIAVEVF